MPDARRFEVLLPRFRVSHLEEGTQGDALRYKWYRIGAMLCNNKDIMRYTTQQHSCTECCIKVYVYLYVHTPESI